MDAWAGLGMLILLPVIAFIFLWGPFTWIAAFDPTPSGASDKTLEIEQAVFEGTNAERVKAGLSPLVRDPNLDVVARDHSLDMAANSYYSHTDLRGGGPTDRARAHGYSPPGPSPWVGLGEVCHKIPVGVISHPSGLPELVVNWPSFIGSSVVAAWMNSPGHRDQMLTPSYRYVGVGIAFDGKYYLATQDFC